MSDLYSSHTYKEYKQFFDFLDTENKGEIKYSQLIKIFHNLGLPLSEQEIMQNVNNSLGYCNPNGVTLKQFLGLMTPACNKKKILKEDKTRSLFNNYDKHKKGYLNIHEFRSLIDDIGDNFSEKEIRDLFNEADLDGNGKIDFSEFKIFWKSC